ncbi:helix-turn-helix domain-containing protein [candidate division KSB3 bacterium]|uniref:Helix-turn-helix domain-containing protein n=1 Tax=candidate division KSB3 bacterium TaxID=2044937 RepID=A0A9D5JSK4_9BACT|nr:helix-turn-helix domain-containing protein [candidate division KSB3 bacterium]MBD3323423.1 helix-turn-helix domain-containing protein [candidate division KSB3 bacterium]
MDRKEFSLIRKKLGKTQKQLAGLLGVSLKAVHSYEQGWRSVPVHVERQLWFLIAKQKEPSSSPISCWTVKHCPEDRKEQCPAWEFQAGRSCWFVNGTICKGELQDNWQEKMKICRSCEVFKSLFEN